MLKFTVSVAAKDGCQDVASSSNHKKTKQESSLNRNIAFFGNIKCENVYWEITFISQHLRCDSKNSIGMPAPSLKAENGNAAVTLLHAALYTA